LSATQRADLATLTNRPVPPLGGFSLTFLYLEVRRLFRNRRTLVFTLIIPAVLFFLFKSGKRLQAAETGDFAALSMIGLSVYGAMIAATSGGALVSVERALGWSRQLRITPLRPPAYIAIKLVTAMVLGLVSVAVVNVVAAFDGVRIGVGIWAASAALSWAAALVFASFGLFMGYLLPSENVMQFIGPVLGIFAFFGGLFLPVTLLPTTIQNIAPYMPPYGVAQIARYPLLGGAFDPTWILSMALWTLAFAALAAVLFRRDTRRV
jgi:ABC-2 type transport system permease protein